MHVIPVIDLLDGAVVHARRGERAAYRPIETPLADDADPVAVVDGLMRYSGAGTLYVADLDAIAGRAENTAALRRIRAAHPGLRLWLDGGFVGPADLEPVADVIDVDVVLATESIASTEGYARLRDAAGVDRCVLSLDRAGAHRRGCAALFDLSDEWPARVIDMNLARVGADGGPDFGNLAALRAAAPGASVFAAGGVRGDRDLHALAAAGAAGALVATALHAGRVTRAAITALAGG